MDREPIEDIEIEIIPAKNAHIDGILEIWKEFMDFHREIDPCFTRSEDAHLNFGNHLRDVINSENNQILIAVYQGRVIAYSIAEIHERPPVFKQRTYGLISDLAVKSDYRRRGIGSQMLNKMIEWFASHSVTRIELRVVSENTVGYSFWKKHGFRDYMHCLYVKRK